MKKIFFIVFFFLLLLSCNDQNLNDRITINVWLDAFDKEMEFVKKTARTFEEKNPEISIEFKSIPFNNLKPSFIGQSKELKEPDIIFLPNDWIGELAEKKLLRPIVGKYDMFLPITMQGLKYRENLYALPRSFEVVSLIYNRKLVSSPPEDLNQLISISKTLSHKGIYGLMYDNRNFYYHFPWFSGYGGRLFDLKGEYISPDENAVASFEFAVSLEKGLKIIPVNSSYSAMMNMFCSQKTGMIITGPWSIGEIEKNNISYGVSPLPLLDNNKYPLPFLGIKSCSVTTLSSHPEIARKVIEFFTSEDVETTAMKELRTMPCWKSIYKKEKLPEDIKGFYTQSQHAVEMPTSPKIKYIWQEYNWALAQIFANSNKTAEYLSKAANEIRKKIKSR